MSGACATCGTAIDASAAGYSESGELICKRCEALQTIRTGDSRAGDAIFGSAVASFVIGLCSLGCNPFLLGSLSAIGAGLAAIGTMFSHPEYRKTLGDTRWIASWVLAIVGILLGLVYPALILFSVLILGAAAAVQ